MGFDAVCMGWLPDASAGVAGVTSVNGDVGPAVSLVAADIPSTGPSDVQTDLDDLAAATSGLVLIDSVAALEAKFPNVAGVHTIDKQTLWVSQTGAPFDLIATGRTISVVNPGTMAAVGATKILIVGSAPGPLVGGELVMSQISVLNVGAGDDIYISSLGGRGVGLDRVFLLGDSAGVVENLLAGAVFNVLLRPSNPGAKGIIIDGVNGTILWDNCSAVAPGGAPYVAWTLAATSTVSINMRFDTALFLGAGPADAMLNVDVAATLPTGPLPTNIVGFEVFACTIQFGAQLFLAGGLDHTDIRILSGSNVGGPTSGFIGQAIADTTVTDTPVPMTQVYLADNTWEVVPSDNGPAAPPNDVTLALTLPLSQRHRVLITSRQVYSLQYDGPEDARQAAVSWKASADRAGGTGVTVDAQLEFDNGGGWTALPDSRDSITLLNGTHQVMEGKSFIAETDNGFALRLVSRTTNMTTNTDWHRVEMSKGI